MPSEDIILGIDLGTTFSAVACVDRNGKTTVLPNCDGAPTTASVIHFVDESSFVIGDEAIKAVVADPSHVARFFKRQMGQADQSFEFYGRRYTPQELTAILLRKLKEDSEEALGQPVRDVVLTVPAYFNAAQRGATAEAGTIAGLNVLSMINEPTAAAIAYGISHLGRDRRLFIFDLGGGTFDVTVMQVEGSALKTIASDGIAELGGKDWDERLVDRVAEIFKSRYNVDPRDDVQVYQELYERCLQSKIALSTQPQVVVPVNYGGHRAGVQVTQADFSRLCADLVEQCTDTCALVLEKANLSWSDIGELVLVGGSTRMPMVREALHRISGLFPAEGVNPDECVALGAALAGVFRHCPGHPALNKVVRSAATRPATGPVRDTGPFVLRTGASRPTERSEEFTDEYTDPSLPTLTITDAATHPLGIIALEPSLEERVVNLIPEGTPLPVERKGRFAYAFDNMTAVRVEVTEGVGLTRDEVMVIGEVVLSDLPPRPRGTRIDVVYRYRLDQLLEVDITDVETRITRRASIHLKGALSPEQVAAAREHIAQIRIL